jgi:hypothetical protein
MKNFAQRCEGAYQTKNLLLLLLVVVVVVIINCKWVCTLWQWYNNKQKNTQ